MTHRREEPGLTWAELVAVSLSPDIGRGKTNVESARLVEGHGIHGDYHAGRKTHRQVSLLEEERIQSFRERGLEARPGSLGENLTTRGLDLLSLPLGTRILIGDGSEPVVLDVSHRGKFCARAMRALKTDDSTILEIDRIYAAVVRGGDVTPGQSIRIELPPDDQK